MMMSLFLVVVLIMSAVDVDSYPIVAVALVLMKWRMEADAYAGDRGVSFLPERYLINKYIRSIYENTIT